MRTLIQTPTPRLDLSLAFYQKLGFIRLPAPAQTFVSDGQVVIEINPDRFARAGVKLVRPTWEDETIAQLKKLTAVHAIPDGFFLADPSGVWVYLMKGEDMMPIMPDVAKRPLGTFAGVSLESTDMVRSLQFWQALGFQHQQGSFEQGWITLDSPDTPSLGISISIMQPMACPHLFFNPSLTYFNGGNNLAIIDHIRTTDTPITEEITHFNEAGIVDNVILRDPGGYGFFVFND